VIARSTAFRYKAQEIDPVKVGEQLKVRAVFTGKAVHRESTMTVQADLIDVANGTQIWGDRYSRAVTDVFAIQDEIVRKIADGLQFKLTGAEQQRLTRRNTQSTEAHDLYLRGRHHAFRMSREGMELGARYLSQAIDADPRYAQAHAALGEFYFIYSVLPNADSILKHAAAQALALDPTLAEAHYASALAHVREWDWPNAEAEFRKAMALAPGTAAAHDWYGWMLAATGRTDESIRELTRAQELDPLAVQTATNLGRAYYFARRNDEAITQLRRAIELDKQFWIAHLQLALAYQQKGLHEEAIAELQFVEQSGVPDAPAFMGHALAVAGRKDEARRILDRLRRSRPERGPLGFPLVATAWSMAMLYTGLGLYDDAFASLEKAFVERFFLMPMLKVDPIFVALRGDPRYANLVRRIGLTP